MFWYHNLSIVSDVPSRLHVRFLEGTECMQKRGRHYYCLFAPPILQSHPAMGQEARSNGPPSIVNEYLRMKVLLVTCNPCAQSCLAALIGKAMQQHGRAGP